MTRHPDSARSYYLYRYLLGRLAIARKQDGSPNSRQTGKRVGDKNLRKILPDLLSDEKDWDSAVAKYKKYGRTTTGELVEMLGTLKETLIQDYKTHDVPYGRLLTTEDILSALYRLIDLTPTERKRLGLPVGDKLTLLQQTLLSLQLKDRTENYEAVFRAYKEAVGLRFTDDVETTITNLDQVNRLIEESVRAELSHLPNRAHYRSSQRPSYSSEETIVELSRKAQREVRRLLIRSGNTRVFFKDASAEHPFISSYLQPAFIKKLSQTVVKNERLTFHLPVFLKRLTIGSRGPLPFSDTSLGTEKISTYPRLLEPELQELDGSAEHPLTGDIPEPSDYELASQVATKVTLYFYIKVPTDYESIVPKTVKALASESFEERHGYRRVDFSYSSTGVGGTLSHIVKIINTTLLSGIPCLSEFFPIAHDVTSSQALIRDNVPSPVWAHSLVKLCHNRSVNEALWAFDEKSDAYDDFSFGEPIGYGDFCGFDFLIAQAQSSLNARLRAIYNTGINPDDYIKELCQKVEQENALRHAWHMLQYYPFSSMAMVGIIHEAILDPVFKRSDQKPARKLEEGDLRIYFDAYLSIAEVLLSEGAYKAAYRNLKKIDILETSVESLARNGNNNANSDDHMVTSSSLTIRYLVCKAFYFYLYDLEEQDYTYWQDEFSSRPTREQLVVKAWRTLHLAQKHIKARLDKYVVIGEISQGTFHPHYNLLSRIYLLRARLLTFFPRLVPKSDELLPTEDFSGRQRREASIHWGKLFLLEKARLYIAAAGDGETYSAYAALQSCYYLTAAYAKLENTRLQNRRKEVSCQLEREHCLSWAKKLRDHALLTYAHIGKRCYNAIKEKSGLPDEFESHGRYSIEKLPAIFEDRGLQKGRAQSEDDQFLTLDVSLLAIRHEDLPRLTADHPESSIYLYGTNACHLFFVRGLCLLGSDTTEEFIHNEPAGPIQWERKLSLARRLFDLAWAIAEDGCTIQREPDYRQKAPDERQKQITRSFKGPKDSAQYTTREIDSVRDLYPRRVNEIADISKVFSAACMVLQLYLLPSDSRAAILQDIDKILSMLHGQYRLENSLQKLLLLRQKRYNGHLADFLADAAAVVKRYQPDSEMAYSGEAIAACRDDILKDLFGVLVA